MHLKRVIPVLLVLLFAFAAFAEEKRYTVPIDDSPSRGSENAPVTIIEFIDFQ
jgi:hypothetical protein